MIYLNKKPLLEDSFNSFVRSINIAFALTESMFEESFLRPSNNNNDDALSKILGNHRSDIKELQKTTQTLKDLISTNKNQNQYQREMENRKFDDKFENLKNVSYQPMTVTKKSRPFTSYPFPFNILYMTKQIFI